MNVDRLMTVEVSMADLHETNSVPYPSIPAWPTNAAQALPRKPYMVQVLSDDVLSIGRCWLRLRTTLLRVSKRRYCKSGNGGNEL
jgi:hypothetical protein